MATESFFQKVLGSFFGRKDPEAEKKRVLKQIAKNLSKTRYKFYKHGSDQVLPALAKFFFEIYKAVAPCQISFNAQQNPNAYKLMIIDYSLSEQQKQLIEGISEESITSLSANTPFDQLKKKVKEDCDRLASDFGQDKIAQIDALNVKLTKFKQFCQYDFYFLLKKFDSALAENSFQSAPDFKAIDASYVAEDLKDFLAVAWALPFNEDWNDVFQLFKAMRGVEPMKQAHWNKIVSRLNQMRVAQVFEMMIQLITKDPAYEVTVDEKREPIASQYIEKVRTEAVTTIRTLENDQKNSKIDSLLGQIFNTTSIFATKHYTEEASAAFQRKGLTGYEYAKPLNYLKSFLIEFVKRDVRELADLVLVRGKWSNPTLSQQMSESYNALMEASEKITAFDNKHNEEGGEFGTKLKTLLPRCDRDREAKGIIRTILSDSNNIAREFIVKTTKHLIAFAKDTKLLLDDYKKQPRAEMLTNWKEVERFAERSIEELSVEVYKKTYLFVQLMQSFLGN